MGRRYRRRNSLGSVVVDIVRIASRLPWWGALLVGLMGYLAIYVGLGGYLEGQLAAQEGSRFYPIVEARYGRIIPAYQLDRARVLVCGCIFRRP